MSKGPVFLGWILSLLLCPNFALSDSLLPSELSTQFIVKYRDSVPFCIHCLVETRTSFRSVTSDKSDSLDRLHAKYQVLTVTPIFRTERRGPDSGPLLSLDALKQDAKARMEKVLSRSPQRLQEVSRPGKPMPDLVHVYLLEVPEGTDVSAAVSEFSKDPHVEYAQENNAHIPYFTPNDPYWRSRDSWGQGTDDLWGLKWRRMLDLEPAWDMEQGEGVVVGVVDTGLDYNHPDIAENVWVNPGEIPDNGVDDDGNGFIDDVRGWNFADNHNDPMDRHGHGTHISGTIAAGGNNNLGVIGVAFRSTVMPVKGLSDTGVGYDTWLAQAIVYAAVNGAAVINCSWGCQDRCPEDRILEEAVQAAMALGSTVVFAAGNSEDDVSFYSPQNMTDPKPVVVSSASAPTNLDYAPGFATNHGRLVDVCAPGSGRGTDELLYNILSLKSSVTHPDMDGNGRLVVGGQYLRSMGTSMAAAHVSGVAALILAQHPEFTPEDVRMALRVSANDFGPGIRQYPMHLGAGMVHAAGAVVVKAAPRITAQITNPVSGFVVVPKDTSVKITGTAAGADFRSYQLFYAARETTRWSPIGEPVYEPVEKSVLGTWDVRELPLGIYVLRLEIASQDGSVTRDFAILAKEARQYQRITTDPLSQIEPKIDGDHVIWLDARGGGNNIFLRDLATGAERRITSRGGRNLNPDISGNHIVWVEVSRGIYLFDLTTGIERLVVGRNDNEVSWSKVIISGNNIVWHGIDRRTNVQGIYLHDIAGGQTRLIREMNSVDLWFDSLDISEDRVIWNVSSGDDRGLHLYEISSGNTRVFPGLVAARRPRLSGNLVVYIAPVDQYPDAWEEVRLFDPDQDEIYTLTSHRGCYKLPQISGTKVLYRGCQGCNRPVIGCQYVDDYDLYTFDLETWKEKFLVKGYSNTPFREGATTRWEVDISGNKAVWEDGRLENMDIFMTECSAG